MHAARSDARRSRFGTRFACQETAKAREFS
jgi:hypothetical protein